MVGSTVGVPETMSSVELANGKSVVVSEENYFDPTAVVAEPVPPVAETAVTADGHGDGALEMNTEKEREIVLGRNVHTTCLAVTEPDADDESTGDKEAYMASVLARYRKSLMERTKQHLGISRGIIAVFA